MKYFSNKRNLILIFLWGFVASVISACVSLPEQADDTANLDFQSAARQGDAYSQYRMGLLYTNAPPQDYKKAAKWFRKAARQGHPDAQYMLGITYYVGRGLPQDYARARDWFQKAGDQGHARAQYQLGEIYMNGRGVRKQPGWAALWYGKAAEQEHVEAQFSLGVVFARGLGLPVNSVRACQWLILAERSHQATAGAVRQKICAALSGKQNKRARDLATRWRMRTYPPYQDPPTLRYIQYSLQQLGYDSGYVDGVDGAQTRKAISRYLSDSGADSETLPGEALVTLLREDLQKR